MVSQMFQIEQNEDLSELKAIFSLDLIKLQQEINSLFEQQLKDTFDEERLVKIIKNKINWNSLFEKNSGDIALDSITSLIKKLHFELVDDRLGTISEEDQLKPSHYKKGFLSAASLLFNHNTKKSNMIKHTLDHLLNRLIPMINIAHEFQVRERIVRVISELFRTMFNVLDRTLKTLDKLKIDEIELSLLLLDQFEKKMGFYLISDELAYLNKMMKERRMNILEHFMFSFIPEFKFNEKIISMCELSELFMNPISRFLNCLGKNSIECPSDIVHSFLKELIKRLMKGVLSEGKEGSVILKRENRLSWLSNLIQLRTELLMQLRELLIAQWGLSFEEKNEQFDQFLLYSTQTEKQLEGEILQSFTFELRSLLNISLLSGLRREFLSEEQNQFYTNKIFQYNLDSILNSVFRTKRVRNRQYDE